MSIEKLTFEKHALQGISNGNGDDEVDILDDNAVFHKINELIETVNLQQRQIQTLTTMLNRAVPGSGMMRESIFDEMLREVK